MVPLASVCIDDSIKNEIEFYGAIICSDENRSLDYAPEWFWDIFVCLPVELLWFHWNWSARLGNSRFALLFVIMFTTRLLRCPYRNLYLENNSRWKIITTRVIKFYTFLLYLTLTLPRNGKWLHVTALLKIKIALPRCCKVGHCLIKFGALGTILNFSRCFEVENKKNEVPRNL